MPRHARRMLSGLAVVVALAGSAPAGPDAAPRVVATYFHRTLRCQTCLQIESLARYDVTGVMADDVETGQLEWRLVNFETEENARFAEEFALEGPSLVVAIEAGGEVVEWVRLDRVWELYGDVEAFDRYVLGTLEEYLGTASGILSAERSAP